MDSFISRLNIVATRLLVPHGSPIIDKAVEIQWLLTAKHGEDNNSTQIGRMVICLDLAASFYGRDLNEDLAFKVSGWEPYVYRANKQIVENSLDFNNNQPSSAPPTPNYPKWPQPSHHNSQMMNGYQNPPEPPSMTTSGTPQYVSTAFYEACRITNAQLPPPRMAERINIERSQQLSFLDTRWSDFMRCPIFDIDKDIRCPEYTNTTSTVTKYVDPSKKDPKRQVTSTITSKDAQAASSNNLQMDLEWTQYLDSSLTHLQKKNLKRKAPFDEPKFDSDDYERNYLDTSHEWFNSQAHNTASYEPRMETSNTTGMMPSTSSSTEANGARPKVPSTTDWYMSMENSTDEANNGLKRKGAPDSSPEERPLRHKPHSFM